VFGSVHSAEASHGGR